MTLSRTTVRVIYSHDDRRLDEERSRRGSVEPRGAGAPRLFGSPAFQLLLLIGVACVLNYVWPSYDRTPPHWDSANHLMSALKFRQVFSDLFHVSFGGQGGLLSFLKQLVFVNTFVHPPLFPFTASLLSPTLAIRSLVMVNGVFLVVLVLAVYGLAGGSTAIWPGF